METKNKSEHKKNKNQKGTKERMRKKQENFFFVNV